MKNDEPDVLVVGAGPVGLLSAVLLTEAGVQTEIIDLEERTTARSYACALHPSTLEMLDRFGLADALVQAGRRLTRMAFYDGPARKAVIQYSELSGKFPFLLVLPQSTLEELLEQRLRKAGLAVDWNHRFDSFQALEHSLEVVVEKLGGTSTGYIVPHWETVVKQRTTVKTKFLVGADGHRSLVRQRLGVQYERLSKADLFAAFEFESDAEGEDEVRVVIDDHTTNVLWPLSAKRFRWAFQLVHTEPPLEFPEKARNRWRVGSPTLDNEIRRYIKRVTSYRAPWFTQEIGEIHWSSQVAFERGLVKEFGRDRCWLAGDAAHQTGPVGVQSMNAGLIEAEALARMIVRVLREKTPIDSMSAYDTERQAEWRRLLGLSGGLTARPDGGEWLRRRCDRILPCLTATGKDLERKASQLGLEFTHSARQPADLRAAPSGSPATSTALH